MNNHVRSVSVHGPKLIYGDLNARLQFRTATEHSIIGQHVFGDSSSSLSASNNRNLLMEVCNSLNLCIANSFFQHSPESTVTYWGIGSTPLASITTRAFAQLDFCIAQQDWIDSIQDVYSDRLAALRSHHFLLISRVRIDIPKTLPRERVAFSDHKACHDVDTVLTFASEVDRYMQQLDANAWLDDHDPCSLNSSLNSVLFHASSTTLPTRKFTARRPWISFDTLILIDQRDLARADGDFDREANLSRQIKQRVKSDKARWLDNAIASGDWKAISSLCRKPKS